MKDGYKLISKTSVILPNGGSMATETIQAGPNDFLVASMYVLREDGQQRMLPQVCGYCDGEPVGCVTCSGPGVNLNCVTGSISCN